MKMAPLIGLVVRLPSNVYSREGRAVAMSGSENIVGVSWEVSLLPCEW